MSAPSRARVVPPRRIEPAGLVLRPWTGDDAPLLLEAVTASFDHLHPWMPWAAEPPTLEGQREFIDEMVQLWDSGEKYVYGVFDLAGRTMLGCAALHNRVGPDALEIGYWVHSAHTGRGIAATCTAVLTRLIMSLDGLRRAEIHCDVANAASAAVPRSLGYRLDRIEEVEAVAPAEQGRLMIWTMSAAEFPGSDAARRAEAAFGDAPPLSRR